MAQIYHVIMIFVIVIGRESTAEEKNAEGLDNLQHLQSEAKPDQIQGIPADLKAKEMRFTPPQLSDEEERSPHMPAYLACDACLAVSTQIEKGLMFAHRHVSFDRNIKQWDVIEVFENICEYKTFEEYGITDYQGKHRLRGPGLDPAVGVGGVSHMGGKWPTRLAIMCLEITGVFEDEEMELYRAWKMEENKMLGEFLCRNSNRSGLDRCLTVVEQGDLVRDDIEDMLNTVGNPEDRNSEPPGMRVGRAAREQPQGLALSDELAEELQKDKEMLTHKEEL